MNRQNTAMAWIVALVVTLLSVLLAFGAARLVVSLNDFDMGDYTALNAGNVSYIQPVDDSVVVYDGSMIQRYASNGAALWGDGVFVGANYTVEANSYGIVLWKGNSFSVLRLSDHQNLYSNNLDGDIISARLGSKYLAVLYGDDDSCTARISDMDGRVLDAISFESQVIVDYGFFSDGSLFWVMTMDTSGTVPTCRVSTYRLVRKSMLGSIADGEQVVYHARFEPDNICLVGEEYIKHYDEVGRENTAERRLVYGWYMTDGTDDEDMMVFVPDMQTSGMNKVSDVRLIRGSYDRILRLPFAAHSLYAKGDTLYAFSDACVMIGSLHSDTMKAYALPVPASDVVGVTDDGVAVIDSNNVYYLVSLK